MEREKKFSEGAGSSETIQKYAEKLFQIRNSKEKTNKERIHVKIERRVVLLSDLQRTLFLMILLLIQLAGLQPLDNRV